MQKHAKCSSTHFIDIVFQQVEYFKSEYFTFYDCLQSSVSKIFCIGLELKPGGSSPFKNFLWEKLIDVPDTFLVWENAHFRRAKFNNVHVTSFQNSTVESSRFPAGDIHLIELPE